MPITVVYGLPSPAAPPPPIRQYLVATANDGDDTVSILLVDPDGTTTLISTITVPVVGTGPYAIAVSPDKTKLAVANDGDGTVSIVSTTNRSLIGTVPVGNNPEFLAWSPSGAHLAVSNWADGTVSVIDAAELTVVATVAVGAGPYGIRFSPDGSYFAVANNSDGTVQTVETAGWTVTGTSDPLSSPVGLDIAPDGSYIAVACGDGSLVTLDPALVVVQTVPIGTDLWGVSIDPVGAFVAVTSPSDNSVYVVETMGWTVTNTIAVGTTPKGVGVAPDSTFVAAGNSGDSTVSIVRASDWAVVATTGVGATPLSLTIYTPAAEPPPDEPTPNGLKNTWRWVITDLASHQKAFLDKLATNVGIDYILDDSAVWTCDLPSDQPDVYQITSVTEANPFAGPRVDYGHRLVYGLRREEPHGGPPWKCRYSGIITIAQDQANEDEPITHVTAHDAWTWAKTLPVLNPEDGSLLGENGYTYVGKTAGYIAKDLIATAYAWIAATFDNPMPWNHLPNDGQHLPIDIDSGHFSSTAVIDSINFAQGISVGEAWTQLCQTGMIDIILEPVYGSPGVLSILNIYAQAGKDRHSAVLGWDLFPRNLVHVDDLRDGTLTENVAQFWAGNAAAPLQTNTNSLRKFGPYYVQKSYPAPASKAAVGLLALAEVALRKQGKRTVLVDTVPERAPDAFTTYYLGDRLPVWAGRPMPPSGNALRGGIRSGGTLSLRVYGFHVDLADDIQETITSILLTDPDETL